MTSWETRTKFRTIFKSKASKKLECSDERFDGFPVRKQRATPEEIVRRAATRKKKRKKKG